MTLATRLLSSQRSWTSVVKLLVPPILWTILYRRLIVGDIPDADCYRPFYSPWLSPEFRAIFDAIKHRTEVSGDRCWTLSQMLRQALNVEGDVLEAGVYRGGTARLLKENMAPATSRRLLLFDSFEGMKAVSTDLDRHRPGDFADTSLEGVRGFVGDDDWIEYHQGWVPDTFVGLENRRFSFAHIDLDLFQSIVDCLEYVYPRLSAGGVVVFDDYGFASCPGARRAVDQFFSDKPERPLALMTGQAIVSKLPN